MSDDQLRALYRILDASLNRAGEGMRTLEEFARFVLDDSASSEAWKALRHELSAAANRFSRTDLLRSRNTEGDVGTDIRQPSEYQRNDFASVIAAAASRTQQSLRTLEEYGKTVDPEAAQAFESIRYRCYTLSAELELCAGSCGRRSRLERSFLYALIGCGSDEALFTEQIAVLADSGVDLFQLRDPAVDDRTLFGRAQIGSEVARQHNAIFIVNDRSDIAVAANADGVHVGQEELPVAQARRIVGPDRLIGVSAHTIQQARQAIVDGADYIGCGPTFPSRTKDFDSFPGTNFLRQIADEIRLPAFAIGGIDMTNVDQVIQAGVRRIAVTGAIRDAKEPSKAAQQLKQKLIAGEVDSTTASASKHPRANTLQ